MEWIATVAALAPVVAAGGLLLYLAVRTTRQVSDAMGEQVMAEATGRVQTSVGDYLRHAKHTSDVYADLLLMGVLPEDDAERWRVSMLTHLRTTPEVASIGFANAEDDYVYLMRFPPELEFGSGKGGPQGTLMQARQAYLDGRLGAPARPDVAFKVRDRPWYQMAMQSRGPTWTPAYIWFTSDVRPPNLEFSVAYTRALHDPKTDRFLGVLSVDTLLTEVNTRLRELTQPTDALLIITDASGELIGASDLGPGVSRLPPGRRMQDIPNPIAKALAAEFPSATTRPPLSGKPSHLTVDGQLYWASQTPLALGPGTQWHVTMAIPEHSILAPVQAGVRWIVAVGTLFIAVAGTISVMFARLLARPLQQLAGFARTVGGGDFDARIDIRASGEMIELSDALNSMARSLQERVQLLAQRDAAEQATAAKSRLIAHVSHEFRTPLNAIINYAELLRDAAEAEKRKRDVVDATNVLNASRHLLSLVENLLELSIIEAGQLRLEITTFTIERLVQEVAATSRPIIEGNKNVQDVVSVGTADASMTSDPTRVRQILINLLANAGKFTRNGRVTLRTRLQDENVVFEVIDNGPGIAASKLERLFEPFVHVTPAAAASDHSPASGAGLGLSISRQLARSLGGDITAETGPEGTRMTVTLPLKVSPT